MWYPEYFGNILSQSASYWWKPDGDSEYEWVKRQFSASPKLPLRLFLTVGLFETIPKIMRLLDWRRRQIAVTISLLICFGISGISLPIAGQLSAGRYAEARRGTG
jgi:hypothetical protein